VAGLVGRRVRIPDACYLEVRGGRCRTGPALRAGDGRRAL